MEPSQADWTLFNTWFGDTFSRQIMASELTLTLVKNQQVLNEPNTNGQTPLHIAALEGNVAAARVLLYLGANPHIKNNQKQYPLFSALVLPMIYPSELISNKITVFQLLLDQEKQEEPKEQEKNIAHQERSGNTVLHQMASHEFTELMSKFLVDHPQLASIPNNKCHYPIHTAILNNQLTSAQLLLQLPDVAALADNKGQKALHYASIYGDEKMIEICRAATTDVNIRDKQNKTPLMFLAKRGLLQEVKNLIEKGANVNLSERDSYTVLHYAVQSDNLDLVSWLIDDQKLDINTESRSQKNPLDLIDQEKNKDLYDFLLDKGARPAGSSSTYP